MNPTEQHGTLRPLGYRLVVYKGYLVAGYAYNRTHVFPYALKGPPCVHAHFCLAMYMAHSKPMYMIEMNQRVLLDTLRFESEGIIH